MVSARSYRLVFASMLMGLGVQCSHAYVRWSPTSATKDSNEYSTQYIYKAKVCPAVGRPENPVDLYILVRSDPTESWLECVTETPSQTNTRVVIAVDTLRDKVQVSRFFHRSPKNGECKETEKCLFDKTLYEAVSPHTLYRALMLEAVSPALAAKCGVLHLEPECKAYREAAERNRVRQEILYGVEKRNEADSKKKRSMMVGLALSGGGIRSASFATGVLQGLHEGQILERVGYLSSVSGGGFAASWYMMHREVGDDRLFRPGSTHLYHLAQHANYLSDSNRDFTYLEIAEKGFWYGVMSVGNVLCNIVWDFGCNAGAPRRYYRLGIANAFQYKEPIPEKDLAALRENHIDENTPMPDVIPGCQRPDCLEGPFWIINMHLSLIHDRSMFKERTGDLFELTSLRAGGSAVGYVDLKRGKGLMEGDWWKPHFAVAISGAAVDSQAGMVSGIPAMLMRGLGLDLGSYANSWSYGWLKDEEDYHTWYWLTTFIPLIGKFSEQHKHTLDAGDYYLTDGGHFENLGAYTLVRRGVRLLIVSDAGYDKYVDDWDRGGPAQAYMRARSFEDLRKFERLIYSDFGAIVEWNWDSFHVITNSTKGSCPEKVRTGVLLGRVRNLPIIRELFDNKKVEHDLRIVYLKAVYSLPDPGRCTATFVDAEKVTNPSFPNNSTVDQFYDEQRVIAYRELGRSIALSVSPVISACLNRMDGIKSDRDCSW